MVSYIHALALSSSHRVLGNSLSERTTPNQVFSSQRRDARGADAGDIVDSLVENRAVLEKVKILETKMTYQVEKLVRIANESVQEATNVLDGGISYSLIEPRTDDCCLPTDPLAFGPNPQNLAAPENISSGKGMRTEDVDEEEDRSGVYRPPKLAPMPYLEERGGPKEKNKRRQQVPSALASLAELDPSNPHVESTSGLGVITSKSSGRARELEEMREFEESNMTRLVMKKRDAVRRTMDEQDIALGGTGMGGGRGKVRGGGFEAEFNDVLKGVGRKRASILADDGYEELRSKGRKEGALERSRANKPLDWDDADGERRPNKKGRFEKDLKNFKRRSSTKTNRR